MENNTIEVSQQKTARVAGFMFLFILIFSTLNGIFVLFKLNVAENIIATANNIIANELLFRIGIINSIILSISVLVIAIALYSLLKSINKNLALLAILFKFAEAILIIFIEILDFIALQILNGKEYLTLFTSEQLRIPVGYFLNLHTVLYACFPMLFLGLGFLVFNFLFFKSKYIPRILAIFGIIAYLLIFIYTLINILAPDLSLILIIQFFCWAPSVFFELIIGIWLITKGVKIQH